MIGARSFRCCFSAATVRALRAFDELLKMNALGLLPFACSVPFFFVAAAFFFFAFAPRAGRAVLFAGGDRVHDAKCQRSRRGGL